MKNKYFIYSILCSVALLITSCSDKKTTPPPAPAKAAETQDEPEVEAEYFEETYDTEGVIDPNDDAAYEEYLKAVAQAEAAEVEAAQREAEAVAAAQEEAEAAARAQEEAEAAARAAEQEKAAKEQAAKEKAAKEQAAKEKAAKEQAAKAQAAKAQAAAKEKAPSASEINKWLNDIDNKVKTLRALNSDAYENRRAIADTKSAISNLCTKIDKNSSYLSTSQKQRYNNLKAEYNRLK